MSQATQSPSPDTILIRVPEHLAGAVRAALNGVALEGYCAGTLSAFQVKELLGFQDRQETQAWLGAHGARQSYSLEDLEADRATLDRILGS